MKSFTYKDITFLVGTSARENWDILSRAEKDHWWVHLDGWPSAHVIVQTEATLHNEDLAFAHQCILEQTPKAPRNTYTRCIYTQVRWVKRGDVVGEVIIKPGKSRYF
jgi:predicted ribosome quality control (RQC) complex YloA/Tae2 family protein